MIKITNFSPKLLIKKISRLSRSVQLSIIFVWMFICIVMFAMTEYGAFGLKLPFGWTPEHYPNNCAALVSNTYGNTDLGYFVERGFPFRSAKITDAALDPGILDQYCGSSDIIISSNKVASTLNLVSFVAPFFFFVIIAIKKQMHKRKISFT